MRPFLIALAVALMASPVAAMDNMERMTLANSLGSLLASEKPCNLSYDQKAIDAFIDANVPADDMQFPTILTTMTEGNAVQIKDMSESALRAHCRQTSRAARSHGFIGE